ncbi:hypothetical protein U2J09_08935 [Serratia liquefaciens]|uniref:hypothetical protein n=1 Tax=Serratia liquefaciens TaxID=614 RepID=UPI0032DE519D
MAQSYKVICGLLYAPVAQCVVANLPDIVLRLTGQSLTGHLSFILLQQFREKRLAINGIADRHIMLGALNLHL